MLPDYPLKAIHEQAKVSISVCSLKREVKVKVTKMFAGLEELINVYKLAKFDSCIINGLWGTKLNPTSKRNCWRWTDRRFSPIHRPDLLCNLVKNCCVKISPMQKWNPLTFTGMSLVPITRHIMFALQVMQINKYINLTNKWVKKNSSTYFIVIQLKSHGHHQILILNLK